MEDIPIRKRFRNDVLEKQAEADFQNKTALLIQKNPMWSTKVFKYKAGDTVTTTSPEGEVITAQIEKGTAGIYLLSYIDELGKIYPFVKEEDDINPIS
jgi:hypothetical protein